MKYQIRRLPAIALTACTAIGISVAEVNAGERVELNQFNLGPVTTRALFPGINVDGPGAQETDWYPVYLWREPSDQCALPVDTDGDGVPDSLMPTPFPNNHSLVFNIAIPPTSGNPIYDQSVYNMGCPLAIEGFGIWGSETDIVPRMANMKGDDVSVYFVHSNDVSLGMTWGDLMNLVDNGCALQGTADLSEVLQSESPDPTLSPGGAQVPKFKISLKGTLNDGTRFTVLTSGQKVPNSNEDPDPTIIRTYKVKGLKDIEQQCQ